MHDLVGHIPGADQQLATEMNDANAPGLNFAQAALVLQNSSNIYSRKVEYLYALVYKSLEDNFLQNTQPNGGQGTRPRHSVPDVDDFLSFDPYQEFLLLDDVLPTDDTPDNRKIDLVERSPHEDGATSTPGRSMTRLSWTEHKSVTAINDVAYKTLLNDSQGSTLRLFQAPVAEDGWLRLPGTASSKRNHSSSSLLVSPPPAFMERSGVEEESMNMQSGFGGFDDGNDDDDDGPGFHMNDDDAEELTAQQMANDKSVRHVTFAESLAPPAPKRDPWALLDPHAVDSATKAKPLKVGKSTRLPEGITEPPSACVTGARTRRVLRPTPSQSDTTTTGKRRFDATESFHSSCAFGKRSLLEKDDDDVSFMPLQGLAFGDEFAYVYQATTKRMAAQRRELRQQEQAKVGVTYVEEEDDDDQYDGGFAFGGDDDDNDYNDAPLEGNAGMASLDDMYDRDNGTFHKISKCQECALI